MALESSNHSKFEIKGPDGGLYTKKPAHDINANQSPDAQNFDPSEVGRIKKRLGHIKFTASAKGSPTGTFCSGLAAATSNAASAKKAWQFDESGASYVDETTDFNSATAADVDPFPAADAINDAFIIGSIVPFLGLNIIISTQGVAGTVAWEYYNGSSWTALSSVTDGTVGFTAAVSATAYVVAWEYPSNWATVAVNGTTAYYVRARLTGTYSTNPVLSSGSLRGRSMVLAAEGTTVQDVSDGVWNTAITGLTVTVDTAVDLVMFNDKFIIANQGGGPFYTTDGVAASALAGSPPANSRYSMVYRNRVFLAPGTNSVVTHSALLDEGDYTTVDNAGSLTFNKGDGMVVNGMCAGQDFSLISKISPSSNGKEGKLYILYGSSPFDWTVRKIADVGALNHKAMIAYDNFIAIATHRGIYAVQGRYPFKLSDSIDPDWASIPNKGTITAGRYMTKLYFSYPASGTANNREFVIDVEHGRWARNSGKTPRNYAIHPDGRLLFGTSGTSLLVWEAENGVNDDGSAINFYYETPDMFFDTMWSPSQLKMAYVHAKTTPSATITVTHYVDGTADSYSDTMAVATEGPVKKLKHFIETRGTMHRLRLTDSSTNGQTEIYSIKAVARAFPDGTQRSS